MLGVDIKPVGSIAIRDAILAVGKAYPTPEHIDQTMRSSRTRSEQVRDAAQFGDKNAAARKLLGDAETLRDQIHDALENAGPEISIGGRVNFDLETEAGKKFMQDLAETLLANTAERLPTSAAASILGKKTRNISGLP